MNKTQQQLSTKLQWLIRYGHFAYSLRALEVGSNITVYYRYDGLGRIKRLDVKLHSNLCFVIKVIDSTEDNQHLYSITMTHCDAHTQSTTRLLGACLDAIGLSEKIRFGIRKGIINYSISLDETVPALIPMPKAVSIIATRESADAVKVKGILEVTLEEESTF